MRKPRTTEQKTDQIDRKCVYYNSTERRTVKA
jgi:hypothetical protein